jgi:hypothetical protein
MRDIYHVTVRFFSEHLVVGVLLVSSLWFYAGYRDLAAKKGFLAFAWQAAIAIVFLVGFVALAARSQEWVSLGTACLALTGELWLTHRWIRNLADFDRER